MDLKLFKINKSFRGLVFFFSILAFMLTGSVTINFITGSNNDNIAFAQSSVTSNSSNTAKSSLTNNNHTSSANNQQQIVTNLYLPANFTRSLGTISSVQIDANGKPSWILSGTWALSLPHPLKINQTNPPNAAVFNAGFEMIKTDGTAMHTHIISDFNLISSSVNKNDLILSGTATVSMKNGPVKAVPITITILNHSALSLSIDPLKTNHHFGDSPIYGTVKSVGVFLSFP